MIEKNAVTLQDVSCFGKCSVTVALPTISAMGISCAVIPTAVLSTHTGGFKGFTFRDLTDDITPIADHWEKEKLTFDGIYTGYLGSEKQIEIISEFFDRFGDGALVFVDPAMADNGVLYSGFDMDFVKAMRRLCAKADVVVPNITEASMLLDAEYKADGYDRAYVEGLLRGLCKLGAKKAVLTGVSFDAEHQGTMSFDSETGVFEEYYAENLPVRCHGTGDVYASAFFGALLLEKTMKEAMKIAVDFTVESIKATMGDESHWYGVKFEKCLPGLIDSLA